MRKDLDDATKQAQDAMNGFENLAKYLRRDCLGITGVPPSENYTCNQLVMAVGQAISVRVKEEDISTSHPLPTFKEDAPPNIIVKFTRRDARNSFYTNRGSLLTRNLVISPILALLREAKYIYPNPCCCSAKLISRGKGSDGDISGLRTAESILKNLTSRQ